MAKPEKTLTRPAARTFSPAFFETGDKTAVLRPIRKRGRSQKRIKMDTLKSANYIKEKRLALGLRESDVAASLGVSSYEVNGWEAGFFPDVEYLLPLAELLQVSVDEILKGDDNPLPPQAKEDESAAIEEKSASAEFSERQNAPTSPLSSRSGAPQASSQRYPPRTKKEKSYYVKLHETMRYTDEEGKPYKTYFNGFSRGERIFGYILCAVAAVVFVVALLLRLSGVTDRQSRTRCADFSKTACSQYVFLFKDGFARNQDSLSAEINGERFSEFATSPQFAFFCPFVGLNPTSAESVSLPYRLTPGGSD